MAALSTQQVPTTGAAITFTAASAGGDTAVSRDGNVLLVKNADASSKTVTLVTPGTKDSLAIADRAVTVAAGATEAILLKHDLYADADGNASITYSAVTSVTVAVLSI